MDCLRSLCLVKSRGLAQVVALGLVSKHMRPVTVNTVGLVGCLGVHEALERQRLPHTRLAQHEAGLLKL